MISSEQFSVRLKEDREDVELLDPGSIQLPLPWRRVFSAPSSSWKDETLALWGPFGSVLPKFTKALGERLRDVTLARVDGLPTVIYGFAQLLYGGGMPIGGPEKLGILEGLPSRFLSLYLELHDGFGFLPDGSLGPLPRRRITTLEDDDWGWLEDSENPQAFDPLEQKLVVMTNGGGGYLCVDRQSVNGEQAQAFAWWTDRAPDRERFWPLLDAWMEIGIRQDEE